MPTCPHCASDHTVKNGWNAQGKQTHLCHDCQKRFHPTHPPRVHRRFQTTVLNALNERMGLRAAQRVFGVHRDTITILAQKKAQTVRQPSPVQPQAVTVVGLELDEAWSFVGKKTNTAWLWVALERETRKILAWGKRDRSKKTAKRLWEALPLTRWQKRDAVYCTDLYAGYDSVIRWERRAYTKGETNHVERFFCTLRQRLARWTRKSLMFSKSLEMHEVAMTVFIDGYNASH
ncbi:MAG: IS1 family transposase [Pleurocapsa sp. SU_196_0]|nr:IS1 family transposase [Pleurocapsa sp. SU_196_0]